MLNWRLFTKKQNPSVPDIYAFRMGPLFDPGAQRAIFESDQTLPMNFVGGAGKLVHGQLQSVGAPQFFTSFAVPTAGYGGLQVGQFALQALENDQLNVGGE